MSPYLTGFPIPKPVFAKGFQRSGTTAKYWVLKKLHIALFKKFLRKPSLSRT
jgi:hypothetical protein